MKQKYKTSFHALVRKVNKIYEALFGTPGAPNDGLPTPGLIQKHHKLYEEFNSFRDLILNSLTPEQLSMLQVKLTAKAERASLTQDEEEMLLFLDGDRITFGKLVEFLRKAREEGLDTNDRTIGIKPDENSGEIWILKKRHGDPAPTSTDWSKLHFHSEFEGKAPDEPKPFKYLDKNGTEIRVGDIVAAGGSGQKHHGKLEYFVAYDLLDHEQKGPDRDKAVDMKAEVAFDTYPPQRYEGRKVTDDFWQFDYLEFESGDEVRSKYVVRDGKVEMIMPLWFSGFSLNHFVTYDLLDHADDKEGEAEDLSEQLLDIHPFNDSLDINGRILNHGDVVQVLDEIGGLGTVEKIYIEARFGEMVKADSQKTARVQFDHFPTETFKSNKRGDFPILQVVQPRVQDED